VTRPHVLVVGQGAPTRGGIPTFVSTLVSDPWLAERASLEHLNTTPRSEKRPAAFTVANLGLALSHAWQVFRRGRDADVVHLNLAPVPTLPLLRALALSLSAKAAGASVVLHAHSGLIERYIRRPIYRLLLRVTLRVVDRFVVVSQTAEGAITFARRKVVRLQNGIDVAALPTGPKEADPPILMFVGTVCERKGLIDLRDALVDMAQDNARPTPRLRVLIVGDSAQEGPGVYERIREAYGETDLSNVEFLGAIDRVRIADLLGRASMFCLPSYWEGFPLSLLEAMAAETAIVATTVGDVPMMLDGGKAGILIAPGDVGGLTSAIARLARNPDERVRLGQEARRRVEGEYAHDRMIRSLWDVYSGLLAHSM
jgi:glycosyltransferase involved in cell wall biosynthesis